MTTGKNDSYQQDAIRQQCCWLSPCDLLPCKKMDNILRFLLSEGLHFCGPFL